MVRGTTGHRISCRLDQTRRCVGLRSKDDRIFEFRTFDALFGKRDVDSHLGDRPETNGMISKEGDSDRGADRDSRPSPPTRRSRLIAPLYPTIEVARELTQPLCTGNGQDDHRKRQFEEVQRSVGIGSGIVHEQMQTEVGDHRAPQETRPTVERRSENQNQ